jgi:hypothetical protein
VDAALGALVNVMLEMVERIQPQVDVENDVATAPAVAARRAAAWHILLAAKGDDTVAAIACLYKDACLIKKHKQSL